MIQTTICYIGGGSADWAVKLMCDLALQDSLTGTLRLYDINRGAVEINLELGRRLFQHPKALSRFEMCGVKSLAEGLDGADIVIVSIEPGPTEMRYADLEIPASYGIVQSVGDTTGPGGINRAWRCVPTFLDFAEKISRFAPDAWVINYTNPMTLCTAALYAGYSKIKAVGCCHEVPVMQKELTAFFSTQEDAPSDPIRLEVSGINHFTFATKMEAGSRNLLEDLAAFAETEEGTRDLSGIAAERRKKAAWFDSDHRIALEFLRSFGSYGLAGDRHLAEFVPWFLGSEAELERYGVVATPYWWRKQKADERSQRNPAEEAQRLEPSGEEGVEMIVALMGGGAFRTNVNVPNRGQIPWLPAGHPVETFAEISSDSVLPETPAPLAPAVEELTKRVVAVQALSLEASIEQNQAKLTQSLLMDPLTHLTVRQTEQMVQKMIHYTPEGKGFEE